ncbi:unnamed protein product [Calypogeia fissa]
MTFIPKVFKVSGLVTLAFLRDEATLLPDGAELIGVHDNESRLEGVIAQAVAYMLSKGDRPLWPHHFQTKYPHPEQQAKFFKAKMDPESFVKKHVLAGKDFANTNGKCTLDQPEEYVLCPEAKDECLCSFEAKDNCIETEFDALNLNNTSVLSTNVGQVAQWKTEGLEEAIQSLKNTIQGLENLKNSLVVQLRQLQEKAFEHYQ